MKGLLFFFFFFLTHWHSTNDFSYHNSLTIRVDGGERSRLMKIGIREAAARFFIPSYFCQWAGSNGPKHVCFNTRLTLRAPRIVYTRYTRWYTCNAWYSYRITREELRVLILVRVLVHRERNRGHRTACLTRNLTASATLHRVGHFLANVRARIFAEDKFDKFPSTVRIVLSKNIVLYF